MSLYFTTTNEKLAEPLLVLLDSEVVVVVVVDNVDDDEHDGTECRGGNHDCCCGSGQDGNDRPCTPTKPQTTCFFPSYYLRSRFIFTGSLFGALLVLAYAQTATSLDDEHDATTTTANNKEDNHPVQLENWQAILLFQLCFLYSFVMFVIYMFLLARCSALKNNNKEEGELTAWSVQIMAVNWTVGIMLGYSVAVSFLFGTHVFLIQEQEQMWQVLMILVVGIALSMVAYGTVMDLQLCFGTTPACPSTTTTHHSCDRKDNSTTEQQEETQNYGNDDSTSLTEAQIV